MARATAAQRAQRLNLARMLLQRGCSLPQAVQRLAKACSLSSRQAYRYIEQAQQLTTPVLKLRRHAARKRLTLSDMVSHALTVALDQGRGRG